MMIRSILFASLVAVLAVGTMAQNGWQKFRMSEGKFSFYLPCTPKIENDPVKNLSKATTLRSYECRQNDIYYVAAYTDYPDKFNQKVAMDAAISDFANGYKGKIVSDKVFWAFSYTGREVAVRSLPGSADGVGVYRFIFVGSRFIAMGVSKSADLPAPMENEKFFSSFALEW